MAEFKVKTNGNADPHGKPRVYFCCHPDDFGRVFYNDKLSCFEKICKDVFKTHDCAIYYTEDMNEPLDDNNINVDLKRMNLFLVPVTFRLMSESCRAMEVDIAYAKANNIKILPFMMEPGLDVVYALQRNFGERQYLNPYSNDATEVGYEEKLKKILEVILISDEMSKKVRAAFDAYIFLSYRKKDRNYANELMRIIHNIPGCRDIAIWYDEFLTPGESWRENIKKAMKMVKEKSNIFTLLVTPNLLEEYLDENGELKKNFVMENEYPEARDMGMDILPTEMVETDRDELNAKYEGIPEPVKSEDEHFTDILLSVIEKIAISENDDDPQHNFLIGLAYLEGIDVEVNCDRGIELITIAAEAGEIAAMRMLYDIYNEGKYVSINYAEALKWAERIYDFAVREYGEEHPDALTPLSNLAYTYGKLGDHKKAFELQEKEYKLRCKIFGEEHPGTLTSLNNLA
ncbi:MAG: tetratricopeptide repeat protein, partial [Clostridia bacterium]|nr:tetratricopeptide repeat protein [Clostridia bacterium]